jgi:hypothetical protein
VDNLAMRRRRDVLLRIERGHGRILAKPYAEVLLLEAIQSGESRVSG